MWEGFTAEVVRGGDARREGLGAELVHPELLPENRRGAPREVVLGAVQGVREAVVQVSAGADPVQGLLCVCDGEIAKAVGASAARTRSREQALLREEVLHFEVLVEARERGVEVRVVYMDHASGAARA